MISPTLGGLDETVEMLAAAGVPLRIDPVLEPIGCGFAARLGRYLEVRRRYPDAEMLMGIGNLTELTDADSAAINVLLFGFCEELGIRSVLTTQVINWARTSRPRMRPGPPARRITPSATASAQASRAATGDCSAILKSPNSATVRSADLAAESRTTTTASSPKWS